MTIKEMLENQPEVIKLLQNSHKSNLFSHAYLFEGPEGSGKVEAAIYASMMLLCLGENKPCFKCNNCIRAEKKNHFNVYFVNPQNDLIKREQIDEFIHELSMTPLEQGPQIGVIVDADKMNSSASNALLKLLEEPAPNHYIFLLTTNTKRLLDTIISRTQVIRFKPLPRKYLMERLAESGIDRDLSYLLSYITSDTDEAKEMIAQGIVYNTLTLAYDVEKAIARGKDPYVYFYKNGKDLKAETDKKWHRIFLDSLLLINKELINIHYGVSDGYFNVVTSLYQDKEIDINKIVHKIEVINNYQEKLNYNVNLNLFYTSLMIELNK